jgi:hypothetical protein
VRSRWQSSMGSDMCKMGSSVCASLFMPLIPHISVVSLDALSGQRVEGLPCLLSWQCHLIRYYSC